MVVFAIKSILGSRTPRLCKILQRGKKLASYVPWTLEHHPNTRASAGWDRPATPFFRLSTLARASVSRGSRHVMQDCTSVSLTRTVIAASAVRSKCTCTLETCLQVSLQSPDHPTAGYLRMKSKNIYVHIMILFM